MRIDYRHDGGDQKCFADIDLSYRDGLYILTVRTNDMTDANRWRNMIVETYEAMNSLNRLPEQVSTA